MPNFQTRICKINRSRALRAVFILCFAVVVAAAGCLNAEGAPLTITVNPPNPEVNYGTLVKFQAYADGGTSPYFYQWERFDGSKWKEIDDAYESYYQIFARSNGEQFQVVVTDSSLPEPATATSNIAKLTVYPVIEIFDQPESRITVTEGNINRAMTVHARANPPAPLDYQWYGIYLFGLIESPIPGARRSSFGIPTNLKEGTYYYQCEVGIRGTNITKRTHIIEVNVVPFVPGCGTGIASSPALWLIVLPGLIKKSLYRAKKQ